jgi:hypothetical protein
MKLKIYKMKLKKKNHLNQINNLKLKFEKEISILNKQIKNSNLKSNDLISNLKKEIEELKKNFKKRNF